MAMAPHSTQPAGGLHAPRAARWACRLRTPPAHAADAACPPACLQAPAALGPYSQAIRTGNQVDGGDCLHAAASTRTRTHASQCTRSTHARPQLYVSGQIGVVPGSKPPTFASDDVEGQADQVSTRTALVRRRTGGGRARVCRCPGPPCVHACTPQVLKNMGAILKAAGADYSHVVKTTILLVCAMGAQSRTRGSTLPNKPLEPRLRLASQVDMADFAAVNAVYGKYFKENPPARATFAVKGLPLGARVEIEAVAAL